MTSESNLVKRAKAGDTRAFEALVNQHARYVYTLTNRLLPNAQEAEDLAQETFIRAWRSLGTFRGDSQFRTWLYRIATNLCYNRLPSLKQELAALDPDDDVMSGMIPDKNPRAEQQVMRAEQQTELKDVIDTLPESYRLLVILRHVHDLSYAEIAQITDLPLGTVKTGIFRARKMLKERLESVWGQSDQVESQKLA
ncbi:MAG: RNA polymerase sigma-70 factor (ECF subfamily) [Cellvibrionaceae bacterium]|jgi:RNA polymerase sigma-70 factor (ECF subfamily)